MLMRIQEIILTTKSSCGGSFCTKISFDLKLFPAKCLFCFEVVSYTNIHQIIHIFIIHHINRVTQYGLNFLEVIKTRSSEDSEPGSM